MANPMCNIPAKAYTVKSGNSSNSRPKPPVSKAVVGKMNTDVFNAINPSATPVKAYIKRTK